MSDVARAAGVSIATVGRVLHNNGYVSKEVRERIEAAIGSLGYVPNQNARTLKSSRSGIIGSLVLQSDNNLYYRINDSIISAARRHGYGSVTMEAQHGARNELQLIQSFIGMGVDGLVMISNAHITPDMFVMLRQAHIPVAAVERGYLEQGVDSLIVNDFEAVRDAAGRIASRGHRRIGLIAVEPRHDVELQRLDGYKAAMKDAGLELDDALIRLVDDYTAPNGKNAANALLGLSSPPTAIMAMADTLAAGAMQAAYERHLRIPDSLSIVGYDDVLSQSLSPAIDSVGLALDGVGDGVMELLMKRMKDPNRPAEQRLISTYYSQRGTVAPPKKP